MWLTRLNSTGNPRKSAQGGTTGLGGQNEQRYKLKTRPWAYFQGGGRHFGETPAKHWHVRTMGGMASNENVAV